MCIRRNQNERFPRNVLRHFTIKRHSYCFSCIYMRRSFKYCTLSRNCRWTQLWLARSIKNQSELHVHVRKRCSSSYHDHKRMINFKFNWIKVQGIANWVKMEISKKSLVRGVGRNTRGVRSLLDSCQVNDRSISC